MTIKEIIILTATYYSKPISEPILDMYCEDLEGLPTPAVIEAYKAYRRDPKNKFFPLPAQIRDMIEPQVNHDAKAREIAARIPAAIIKFGWANPSEAQAYIGEVGWDVVQTSGGWSYLCQNHGVEIDPGQFMAQTRDRLKDRFQYGKESIHQQVIEHKPKAEVIQLEAKSQERQAVIQNLLTNIKKV